MDFLKPTFKKIIFTITLMVFAAILFVQEFVSCGFDSSSWLCPVVSFMDRIFSGPAWLLQSLSHKDNIPVSEGLLGAVLIPWAYLLSCVFVWFYDLSKNKNLDNLQ